MDQQSPPVSPHRVFTRDEWARLRADTPLTLDEGDVTRLKSLNDPILLDERSCRSTCRLSRLLSLYVAAIQNLYQATRTFLGDEDGVMPFIIGIAGLGRGRQVDHGAASARPAASMAEHAEGRPDGDRRFPAAQRGPEA